MFPLVSLEDSLLISSFFAGMYILHQHYTAYTETLQQLTNYNSDDIEFLFINNLPVFGPFPERYYYKSPQIISILKKSRYSGIKKMFHLFST